MKVSRNQAQAGKILVMVIAFSLAAPATVFAISQKDIDAQQKVVDNLNTQIATAQKNLAKDKVAANSLSGMGDVRASCDAACGPTAPECSQIDTLEKLSPTDPNTAVTSPSSFLCVKIYSMENAKSSSAADAGPANTISLNGGGVCLQGPVASCPIVQKKKAVDDDTAHITDLQSQLKDAQAKLDKDNDDYSNCPNCQARDQMQSMYGNVQQPSTLQNVMGIIGAATPLALGGLSTWMYARGMGQYYNAYNGYLSQCTTIGIPCGPPSYAGGMAGGMMGGLAGGITGLTMMGFSPMTMMGMGMSPMMGFSPMTAMGMGMGMSPMMGFSPMTMMGMGMSPMMGFSPMTMMGMGMSPMMGFSPMTMMGMSPMTMMGMGMSPMMGFSPMTMMGMSPMTMMGMGMSPMMGFSPMTAMGMSPMMGFSPYSAMGMSPMMGFSPMSAIGIGAGMSPMMGFSPYASMGISPMMGFSPYASVGFSPYSIGMGAAGFSPYAGAVGFAAGMGMSPLAAGFTSTGAAFSGIGFSPYTSISPLAAGFSTAAGFTTAAGFSPFISPYGSMSPYGSIAGSSQYGYLYQLSQNSAALQAARAAQAQSDTMTAAQQVYESELRYNSTAQSAYTSSLGSMYGGGSALGYSGIPFSSGLTSAYSPFAYGGALGFSGGAALGAYGSPLGVSSLTGGRTF